MKTHKYSPSLYNLSRFVLLLCIISASTDSFAQTWEKKAQLIAEINFVTFLSPSVGFAGLGLGEGGKLGTCEIYKTTDGGDTWIQTQIPYGYAGAVTGILMWNDKSGLASVQPWRCNGDRGIWRTDDGGMTWTETSLVGACTSIWQTSKALIATDILGQGHISVDSGRTWTGSFISSTNDVVFVDDSHGLITDFRGQNWLVTSDGGLTWDAAGSTVESWGAYAVPGTTTYYAAPEGPSDGSFYHTEIMRSDDFGMTWNMVAQLPFRTTGHITGVRDDALYIQTNWAANADNGHVTNLWKSTDKGVTWTNINGPGTWGDTRFTVWDDGCNGTVVWAFDSTGGLYKLSDSPQSFVGEVAFGAHPKVIHAAPLSTVKAPIEVGVPPTKLLDTMSVREITIGVRYHTDVIDLDPSKLKYLIEPPSGWSVQNPVLGKGVLKYTLVNDSNAKVTNDLLLGDIIFSTYPSSSLGSLVELNEFSIKTSNSLYKYCLSIEGDYLDNILLDKSGVAVAQSILDEAPYPNPIRVGQVLQLRVRPDVARVQGLQIVDLLGRQRLAVAASDFHISSDGRFQVTFPNDLLAGTYYLRLETSVGVKTEKVSVTEAQ